MTAEIESLVLEHLRHIRARVDQIADDVGEVKHRLSSLEFSASRIRADIAHGEENNARQQAALDRLAVSKKGRRFQHLPRPMPTIRARQPYLTLGTTSGWRYTLTN